MNENSTKFEAGETLKILRKLAQKEDEKTTAIAELTQLVEQGLRAVQPTEKAVREALNAQYKEIREREKTVPETPENVRLKSKILDLLKGASEAKISKIETKIAGLKSKISGMQSETGALKKHVALLQVRIQKTEQKILGLRSSSEILQDARTKGNGFIIVLLTRKNDRDAAKLQDKIGRFKTEISAGGAAVKTLETKISGYDKRISELKNEAETQAEKIKKMSAIDKSGIPHAALTYFLTEQSAMNAAELNAAELNAVFEQPAEFLSEAKSNAEMTETMTAAAEIPLQETDSAQNLSDAEREYYNGYRRDFADGNAELSDSPPPPLSDFDYWQMYGGERAEIDTENLPPPWVPQNDFEYQIAAPEIYPENIPLEKFRESGEDLTTATAPAQAPATAPPENYAELQNAVHDEFYRAGLENAAVDTSSRLAERAGNASLGETEKTALQSGEIPRDMPTEIIELHWHKKENLAYLCVNRAAFPDGADLSEHEKICRDFGVQKCENRTQFNKIDIAADAEARAQVGLLGVKPTVEFLATYVKGDTKVQFSQAKSDIPAVFSESPVYKLRLKNDFPVVFNRSNVYNISWLEPDYNAKNQAQKFNETVRAAEIRCASFGVKPCENDREFLSRLSEFGENAAAAYRENAPEIHTETVQAEAAEMQP